MGRLTKDLEEIGEVAHHGPEDVFVAVMTFLGALALMYNVHPPLATIAACIAPLVLFLIIGYGGKLTRNWKVQFERVGAFNARIFRTEFMTFGRYLCDNIAISDGCPVFHQANDGERNLMPHEEELLDLLRRAEATTDQQERIAIARRMQMVITDNVHVVGVVQMPAALLIGKRIRNAHPSTPVRMYEWAEDAVIRERLWTPGDLQLEELFPGRLAQYD